nr:NADH dehydrogenase subunit 2 [Pteroptyx maipo]
MTKMYKLMFMTILMMSTMFSISAYTWLGMWVGLEINFLSIIPIIMNKIILSSEAPIKYFITQGLASTMIMMSIIIMMWKMNFTSTILNSEIMLIMNSGHLLKMGMARVHFWFPEVLEGLNWNNCMIMLTWQKIAPMMLYMYHMESNMFNYTIILTSMIISSVMSFNQISMRKLMAFSSINHMAWMMAAMKTEKSIWMLYFLIFAMITINIWLTMKIMYYLNQLFLMMNESFSTKIMFMLNFMSLKGIPPFLGFLPKWLVIQTMIEYKMMFLSIIMILFTLIMIFVYMRISMSTLIMKTNQINWKIYMNNKTNIMLTSMLNFFMIFSLILMTIALNEI